ncbi:hypothetical protein [Emticicia sp. C21]|uniref:hypothetical protein n=1 Tax=Emticicia sp. C21 TaxID=2302915 RepID=UPI000E3434A0|nr:hypothetical protein [Emticicia sp. C21]RFS14841.1 hypothetical protein D0T08_19485 [Emticicia sp. C21]
MKKTIYILFLGLIILASACEKKDPFVDRVVSPLLFLVIDDNGVASSGLTTEPTVSSKISKDVTFSVKLVELDKTNILDNTKGIDSLAVKSLPISLSIRGGAKIGDLTTNEKGMARLTKSWVDLGIAAPKAGTTVLLSWSGTYKDVKFTKYTRVQGAN